MTTKTTTTMKTDEVKLVRADEARERMIYGPQRKPQGPVSAKAARERMIAAKIREEQR